MSTAEKIIDTPAEKSETKRTVLYDVHKELGAKMTPFAGYDMPLRYPAGFIAEHRHVRTQAGLFDVSHMGQIAISGAPVAEILTALEKLMPTRLASLNPGDVAYSVFLNDQGGILDDLLVTNRGEDVLLVVNAAMKHQDLDRLRAQIGSQFTITDHFAGRALLALQGPTAATALATLTSPEALQGFYFMQARAMTVADVPCWVSRTGYTGEDGFEIACESDQVETLARALLECEGVEPAGLGCRDSLRLEAGLCLYGQDMDTDTTPIEANIAFVVSKARRRESPDFPGSDKIMDHVQNGTPRKRMGLLPEGNSVPRTGAELFSEDGQRIGEITSGAFSPILEKPIAVGYINSDYAKLDTTIIAKVKTREIPCRIVRPGFVPPNYVKKPS